MNLPPFGTYVNITGISLRLQRKPSHKLEIFVNDERRCIEGQDKDVQFRWNVSDLHIFPDDTLKIVALQRGLMKHLRHSKPLCEWTRSGAELLRWCREGLDERDSSVVTLTMSLEYFFAKDHSHLPLPSTDDIRDPSKLETVLGGLNAVYSYVQSNASVLESIDGAKQIFGVVGEIHPFAKAAVTLLTIPYNIWRKKQEYEKSLRELQESMKSLLKRIVAIRPAAITDELKDVIISVVKALLDGVCMLEIYSSSSSIKKLVASQFQSDLDTFKKKVADLERDLSSAGLDQVVIQVQDVRGLLVTEQEATRVRSHLRPVELSAIPGYCLSGTRKVILAEIDRWVASKEEKNILWITGQPGSGKSTIAATVFKEHNARCARFFFKRDEERLCKARNVWRTIACSIAEMYPEAMDHYATAVGKHSQYAQDTNIDDQFQQLVCNPLRAASLDRAPSPIIILDALDECDSGEEFSMLLETLRSWSDTLKHHKLIITSRDYPQIRQVLEPISNPILLHTGDTVDDDSSKDVRNYLIDRFSRLDPSRTWPSEQKIDELTSIAAGLFVWAKIALDFLGSVRYEAEERLKRIPGDLGSQQKNLDSLYNQVLKTTFSSLEGEAELQCMKRVLSAIITVKDPLTSDALSRLLHFPVQAIDNAARRLSGVIPHHPTEQPLRICHKSFLDFMNAQLSLGNSPYVVPASEAHINLADGSLNVLRECLKFNICRLETSFLFNEEFPQLEESTRKHLPLYLIYASRFWATHLSEVRQMGNDSLSVSALANNTNKMLSLHLLHWLEVLSLIRAPGAASEQLLICLRWARDIAGDEELYTTVMDASRFAAEFRHILDRSALHIYQSAPPFCPDSSRVYQRFGQFIRNTVKVNRGRSTMWSSAQCVIYGHTSRVSSVGFSPDRKKIVSGSSDNTIRFWDSETGVGIGEPLRGHTDSVVCVAISPDGKKIVSGSRDRTIRLWDSETGVGIGEPLQGHTDLIFSVAISPDGKKIASASWDNTIRVWDSETGSEIGEPLRGHTDRVNSVAFSPDGKKIVSGSSDNTIRMWESETGTGIGEPFRSHTSPVWFVAFSTDGKKIVSGSWDMTIRVWDSETGTDIGARLRGQTGSPASLAISSDWKKIASGSTDHTIRVWDSEVRSENGELLRGHTDSVVCVAFSSDGKKIVSGSTDHTIRVWDPVTGTGIDEPLRGHTDSVFSVAVSLDGKKIVSASSDCTIRFWDSETGAEIGTPLRGHTSSVFSMAISPDGKKIASGSSDKTIRVWDFETGAEIGEILRGHTDLVASVAFSPDGKKIVSGSLDSSIRVWDSETRAEIGEPLRGHTGPVYSIAHSPDGSKIVSGSWDHTIRIWDSERGVMIGEALQGHTDSVTSVSFSPDGKKIASSSSDNTIRVWDPVTGAEIGEPLCGHSQPVVSIAFSSDGKKIVSGSWDMTIRLWDSETGAGIGEPFRGHARSITTVAFFPDGTRIVSGSQDKTIRVWDSETGAGTGEIFGTYAESVRSADLSLNTKPIESVDDRMRIQDPELHASPSTGKKVDLLGFHIKHINPMSPTLLSHFLDYRGRRGPPDTCYVNRDGWLIWPREDINGTEREYKVLYLPRNNCAGYRSPRCTMIIGPVTETVIDWAHFADVACTGSQC